MEWRNLYRGFLMGITDLIPGVSGGTIAFVLGIYDRLLEAISGFFGREWKRQLRFLIPLAVGIGAALLSLSKAIDFLLEHHYVPTQFFFIGLIIGVLPMMVREADVKRNFAARHWIVFAAAAVAIALTAFLKPDGAAEPITSLTVLVGAGLFLSGWAASMAMLLPGVSGSFILLLLGVYATAVNALSTLNLPVIAVIGAGVIVGFIVSSKGIRYLLAHFPHMMYAVIIGLIAGSVFVVFPGMAEGPGQWLISLGTFALGLLIALFAGSRQRSGEGMTSRR